VYNKCFTDDAAHWYGHTYTRTEVLFICDIRSNAYDEQIIRREMEMQYTWSALTHAAASMLKFRLPFPTSDGEDEYMPYVAGRIMLQAYAPENSTECRCIIDRNTPHGFVNYRLREHEERMCWFNTVLRERENYDAKAEAAIWEAYVRCDQNMHNASGQAVHERVNKWICQVRAFMARRSHKHKHCLPQHAHSQAR
jgi:hypothetical protein